MKYIQKILLSLLATVAMLAPAYAYMNEDTPQQWNVNAPTGDSKGLIEDGQANIDSEKGFLHIADNVIRFMVSIISALCVLMVIIGGAIMTGGAHNEENIKKGKDMIKWAIVGLVVVMCSYAIVRVAQFFIYNI